MGYRVDCTGSFPTVVFRTSMPSLASHAPIIEDFIGAWLARPLIDVRGGASSRDPLEENKMVVGSIVGRVIRPRKTIFTVTTEKWSSWLVYKL